ncbi:MAG: NAD-binding protein, partial [Dehalococcoidia bacterium]
MKVLIMGCGRVGARLASLLDEDGHEVTVLDNDVYSFRRLPSTFGGSALFGNGIDEEALKKAGIEEMDV